MTFATPQDEIAFLRGLCREVWQQACDAALVGGDAKAFGVIGEVHKG